jgi:hypothetical protein
MNLSLRDAMSSSDTSTDISRLAASMVMMSLGEKEGAGVNVWVVCESVGQVIQGNQQRYMSSNGDESRSGVYPSCTNTTKA